MTLRLRLTLAALAVTLPMGLLLLWYDTAKQHDVAEQLLAELIEWRMTTEHARCEAAPESFGGLLARADMPSGPRGGPAPPPEDRAPPPQPDDLPPSPPPRHRDGPRRAHGRTPTIFAYDENLQSRNPNAPVIPKELVDAIRTRDVATSPFGFRSSTVEVLVALSGRTGPCAYVLARGTTNPEWGIFPESNLWVLPTIAVFAAMLLVLGPVVRRIQKLTLAVRRSANSEYASAIVEDGRDEIAELARAFNAAGREIRLQLAEKDKRERTLRDFLANTTHDVMIPLTVLQGHLAALREGERRGDSDFARTLVSAMSEAHYMASLVHNLGA
ncbi:MAG TPA: HAMP domain-containing protein, partial [Polyangiaceae bacterium]|nr:HAMP domain-containing protein [Polyangiaceae bacterium]